MPSPRANACTRSMPTWSSPLSASPHSCCLQEGAYCGGPSQLTEVAPLPPEWKAREMPVLQQGTCHREAAGCGKLGAPCCHRDTERSTEAWCEEGLEVCRRPAGAGAPAPPGSSAATAPASSDGAGSKEATCTCEKAC